jgi:hypothetical protein
MWERQLHDFPAQIDLETESGKTKQNMNIAFLVKYDILNLSVFSYFLHRVRKTNGGIPMNRIIKKDFYIRVLVSLGS